MHRASAPRFALMARAAMVGAACLLPCAAAWADTVYVVSKSTGGLFRFDSANPLGTLTVISGTGTFNTPTALAMGPDGHLYVGESGDSPEFVPRISKVVVSGSTATISTAVTLTGTDTAIFTQGGKLYPAAIAFRRTVDGGEMLVGRNPEEQDTGPVVKVTGWNTLSPTVANFTSGTALASSPGLAVSAADGRLYVSDSSYGGVGAGIVGSVEAFAAGAPAAWLGETAPAGAVPALAYGPTGLVVSGSMLYSASTQNSSVYVTTLVSGSPFVTGSTTLLAAIDSAFGFDAGPLARLSNGDLLTGSVTGFNPSLYLVPALGTAELLQPFVTYPDFGAVGGIVTMAVPEPGTAALALVGGAALLAWRRRRTVA